MNPNSRPLATPGRRPPRGFALVIVLVILSLLAVIAVGYLSSMASERATASAFSNKTRAEQAAQAGVDSAMGVLRDYFKAFPDSVTAWDPAQSINPAPGPSATPLPANEGTTLYLRAVPNGNGDLPDPAPQFSDPKSDNADFAGGNGPNNVDATTGVDNRKIFALPLVSGATVKRLEQKAAALPTPGADNYVNLNVRRQANDTQGWIGTPPTTLYTSTSGLPKPVSVPWVEIRQQEGYPITSSGASPTPIPAVPPPLVGRYAYWVEDESFRANISYAKLGLSNTHQRRDNTKNYPLNPTDQDLLGSLDAVVAPPPAPAPDPNATAAQSIFDTRAFFPGLIFPEARAFAHTEGLSQTIIDGLRYLTTSQSATYDLSRHGTQRLNLNALIPPDTTVPPAISVVQKQIDTIVKTIQFHAPNFGQRFYRIAPGQAGAAVSSGSITAAAVLNQMAVTHDAVSNVSADVHAKIYDYKIAANIRDYMDADSLPTYVAAGGTVAPPLRPTLPFGDNTDNPYWAVGKDSAPFMQECATRFTGTSTPAGRYTLYIDYYVEFWNMSTKDVKVADLGKNPFIRIAAPPKWVVANSAAYKLSDGTPVVAYSDTTNVPPCDDAAYSATSPSDTRGGKTARDYDIDLASATYADGTTPATIFPAGKVTLITTDPNFSQVITDNEARKNTLICKFVKGSPGKRYFTGPMPPNVAGLTGGRPSVGKDVLTAVLESNTGGTSDYLTYVTIGNDSGYLDCLQGALNLSYTGHITDPAGTTAAYPLIFGAVARGNWTNDSGRTTNGMQAASLGDPRANNEQLSYNLTTGSAIDRSRYNNYEVAAVGNSPTMTVGSPDIGVYQTLGLPNYRSVRPNRPENPWPDFPPMFADPNNPFTDYPSHQNPKDELVLTAAKAPMAIANGPLTSIGQLGDIFDSARMLDGGELKYSHGGGRSLKIGQHDDRWDGDEASASRTWAAWRLVDMFSTTSNVLQPGLININGVIRDGGAALRAALLGFKFQPVSPDGSANPDNPNGDPLLVDSTSTNAASRLQIDKLVTEISDRLKQSSIDSKTGLPNFGPVSSTGASLQTGAGPFWERGELSELPGFGRSPDQIKPDRTSGPNLYEEKELVSSGAASIDMSKQVFDRGREELFRRLVEMTTTRGNVFTVYALGQSISQTNPISQKHITGTHQLKVTFRLVPKMKTPTGYVDFHPGTAENGQAVDFDPKADMNTRFAKPDHYDIEVLSTSSGNS